MNEGSSLVAPTIFLVHFMDLGGVFSYADDIVIELGKVACSRQLGPGNPAQRVQR